MSTAYVLDFRNTLNCVKIESAQKGEELTVLVRPEHDLGAAATRANAKRSVDGATFAVTVQESGTEWTHTWNWDLLQDKIKVHRGKS